MSRSLKHEIEEIGKERAPGPSAAFSIPQILRALELIAEKPIGRNTLAQKLMVGEGVARTIISRLKTAELIKASKAGCRLTNKGSKLWHDYQSIVKTESIEKNEIVRNDFNVAVLARDKAHKLKSGIEQRDAAVGVGAGNATSMVMREGRLVIPLVSNDISKDFPKAAKQITSLLAPKNGDVIILVGADSSGKALYGATAAAWVLLD
jgi:predicted transcriptional regulator